MIPRCQHCKMGALLRDYEGSRVCINCARPQPTPAPAWEPRHCFKGHLLDGRHCVVCRLSGVAR